MSFLRSSSDFSNYIYRSNNAPNKWNKHRLCSILNGCRFLIPLWVRSASWLSDFALTVQERREIYINCVEIMEKSFLLLSQLKSWEWYFLSLSDGRFKKKQVLNNTLKYRSGLVPHWTGDGIVFIVSLHIDSFFVLLASVTWKLIAVWGLAS